MINYFLLFLTFGAPPVDNACVFFEIKESYLAFTRNDFYHLGDSLEQHCAKFEFTRSNLLNKSSLEIKRLRGDSISIDEVYEYRKTGRKKKKCTYTMYFAKKDSSDQDSLLEYISKYEQISNPRLSESEYSTSYTFRKYVPNPCYFSLAISRKGAKYYHTFFAFVCEDKTANVCKDLGLSTK